MKTIKHPLEEQIRRSKKYNFFLRYEFCENGYRWSCNRTGSKWHYQDNPVSNLIDHECQICKIRGHGGNVRQSFEWADPVGPSGELRSSATIFTLLCNRCRMTLHNCRVKWLALEKLKFESNRIRRILNETTKNNARTS